MYWSQTSEQLETLQTQNHTGDPRKGTVYFGRTNSTSEDITDLLFFDVDYRWMSHGFNVESHSHSMMLANAPLAVTNIFTLTQSIQHVLQRLD